MERKARIAAFVVMALALCVCAAAPAIAQQDEPVLLQAKYVEDDVQALEVQVRQSGKINHPAMPQPAEQVVEVDVTGISRVRDVADGQGTTDSYTLGMRMKVTSGGQVQVDTGEGLDLDLGSVDPRGQCETTRSDARNHILERITAATRPDPLEQMQIEMMAILVSPELPEGPVKVGDSWVSEVSLEVGDGGGSARVEWSLEAVEVVDGVRVARIRGLTFCRVVDVASPTKSGTFDTPEGRMKLRIDEYIHELVQESTTTLLWDIDGGRVHSLTSTGTLTAGSSHTVRDENGAVLQTLDGLTAERSGTTTLTFREPTDQELAMMAVLALTNTINRQDRSLLATMLAEGTDTAQTDEELGTLADAYITLEAKALDPRFTLGDTEGSVTFNLVVRGSLPEERPGSDEGDLLEVVNSEVKLSLTKTNGLWLISGIG